MGVKNIKLKKVADNNETMYFIDYFKYKNSDQLIEEVLKNFIGEKGCLFVIDTENFFDRKASVSERKIFDLKQQLDDCKISYRTIVSVKDGNDKIFGIMVLKPTKVNSYKLGIAADVDRIHDFIELFRNLNVFCYIPDMKLEEERLLELFDASRGGFEELIQEFNINLYIDSYFRRIRISGSQNKLNIIEEKLNQYQM